MPIPIRSSVRIILLNESNDLLLIATENANITTVEGMYYARFWHTVGGEIDSGESIQQAALREIYEETGIKKEEVALGPVVWFGEFDLILKGTLTRFKEKFIVAKTKQNKVFLNQLTQDEQTFIKELQWFSLDMIQKSTEIIFPILLPQYLPDILSEKYPDEPFEINLRIEPDQKKI